jgi:hypothetical protein
MLDKVIRVKLQAIKEGVYTMYVFKNLEDSNYIMCTRLPNWQTPDISIGDVGFLNYQVVKAGEEYYNPITEEQIKYSYSNIYFINFVRESEIINNNSIII